MATQSPITTTTDYLDVTDDSSLVVVTNTGAVLSAIVLHSSSNVLTINGYVGTINGPVFDSSVDNIIHIGGSGLLNSIQMYGGGNKINNAGTVSAVDHGNLQFGYSAIYFGPGYGTDTPVNNTNYITNSGSIFTSNRDYYVPREYPLEGFWARSYGVDVENGLDTILNNSGTISATYGHGIKLDVGSDTFTNTGTVFGNVELGEGTNTTKNSGAITGDLTSGSGDDVTHNSGTIDGNVILGNGSNVTYNSGTIDGDLVLGDGNNVARNSGTIDGNVILGNGSNVFRSRTGEVFGAITGGDGHNLIYGPSNGGTISTGSATDTIHGGDGDDYISGGGGADILIGGAGDDTYSLKDDTTDTIRDSDGNDTISSSIGRDLADYKGIENITITSFGKGNATGDAGDNKLIGSYSANILDGGDGNDILAGSKGTDTLLGGSGKDVLDGGIGADILTGGAGSDTFVYLSTYISAPTTGKADTITDWSVDDRIDTKIAGTENNFYAAAVSGDVDTIEEAAAIATSTAPSTDIAYAYLYNSAKHIGFLIMDIDNNDKFETGIVLAKTGAAGDFGYADLI
jgi:Ca2+-binding RTX toxin-like protein